MSYPVMNLIEGRGDPVCVHPTDPARKALNLMIENDFSQLPVIDEARRLQGLVTRQSILQAHTSFGLPVDKFLVSDAMIKIVKGGRYSLDDDLLELFDRLRDTSAVLVVDREDRPIGIVTSYDAMEYLRRRAEDLMYVEDIEYMVRDRIQAAFIDENGEIAEVELQKAIEDITDSRQALVHRYRNALKAYLEFQGDQELEIDEGCLEASFSCLAPRGKPKTFEELSLHEYTELLLHKSRWDFYRPFFRLEPEAIRRMLNGVREIRNTLVHFRGEITAVRRKQLKSCAQWLRAHPVGISVEWPSRMVSKPVQHHVLRESGSAYKRSDTSAAGITPTDEEFSPYDSRYAPLAVWLRGQPVRQDRVDLTFEGIEEIIGGTLPKSAREHRAWWANDTVGHSQSQHWLDVGWRVWQVNMAGEKVTFARIKEHKNAYVDFFGALQADLGQERDFLMMMLLPDGRSWQTVAALPEGGPHAFYFVFSFTRLKRFRVELYIDTADQGKNKRVFDLLHARKDHFEAALGEELDWERLDQNRASRIAVYHSGFITDSEEQLTQLRTWAVDTMLRFYQAFAEPASQALDSVEQSRD